MEIGTEISKKIRAAIKTKLEELGAYVDEELPDYIMVMVANKKTKDQMRGDLSLFLGVAAESFTDWLQQLLNKLQNITAETLERQLKAQQKAEKSGQSDQNTKVLMTLDKKSGKGEDEETLVPPGDYISIRTDEVIEDMEDIKEKTPPVPSRKESTTSAAHKRRPESASFSQVHRMLDEGLKKKRLRENEASVAKKESSEKAAKGMTRQGSKEDSATTSKRLEKSSKMHGVVAAPGSMLKERDLDEHGRIIGSIVKVTDKKGKSLLQSKVSSTKIASSATKISSTTSQRRPAKSPVDDPPSTSRRGIRLNDVRTPSSERRRQEERRQGDIARRRDDVEPRPDNRRQEVAPQDRYEMTTTDSRRRRLSDGRGDHPQEFLYDRERDERDRRNQPLWERRDPRDEREPRDRSRLDVGRKMEDREELTRPSSRLYSDRMDETSPRMMGVPRSRDDVSPQAVDVRDYAGTDALSSMAPPSRPRSLESRRREGLERRKSGDKRAAKSRDDSPPAIVLKKYNGKTVTVSRAHLQSFKVHIKNRQRHPSDDASVAVDDYSVYGDSPVKKRATDTSPNTQRIASPSPEPPPRRPLPVPDEPEPYGDDTEEEEEILQHHHRADVDGDRSSEPDRTSPSQAEHVDPADDENIMDDIDAYLYGREETTVRNVRPKSPASSRGRSFSGESAKLRPVTDQRRFQANDEPETNGECGGSSLEREMGEKDPFRESEDDRGTEEDEEEVLKTELDHDESPIPTEESNDVAEPAPPGTEEHVLLPHEKPVPEKRREEKKKRRKREKRAKKHSGEKKEVGVPSAEVAGEEPDWRGIVSSALTKTEQRGQPETRTKTPPPSNQRSANKPRLKRPPPLGNLATPPPIKAPARTPSPQNESPKFIVTLDGVSPGKYDVGDDVDRDAIAAQNRDLMIRLAQEEEMTLDGEADDDAIIYINEDDVEEHDASFRLAFDDGPENGESKDVVPARPEGVVKATTTPLPKKAAAAAVVPDKKTPVVGATKAMASVAPQRQASHVNLPSNPFSWQNPSANGSKQQPLSVLSRGESELMIQTLQSSLAGIRAASVAAAAAASRGPTPNAAPLSAFSNAAIPQPAVAEAHSKERCRFWPACRSGEACPFQHPTTPCKAFPKCRFGDKCLFIHPNCKYDAHCTKLACPYTHASKRGNLFNVKAAPVARVKTFVAPPTAITLPPGKQCRFGNACANPQCTFFHPGRWRESLKPDPGEMSTEMAEKILNFPTKLVWKKH